MRVGKAAQAVRAGQQTLDPRVAAQVAAHRSDVAEKLVRAAGSAEAAWEALGGRDEGAADKLLAAKHVLGVRVKAGRERWLAQGGPCPPAWRELFLRLHRDRVDLAWRAERLSTENLEPARMAELAEDEVYRVLGKMHPDEGVQRAMHDVNAAVGFGTAEEMREACMGYVAAAVAAWLTGETATGERA